MSKKTAIIIGAGPGGLTATKELIDKSDITPIIFEATADIGGISKTVNYKGNKIDIGGHRFFSKSDVIVKWWPNRKIQQIPNESIGSKLVQIDKFNKKILSDYESWENKSLEKQEKDNKAKKEKLLEIKKEKEKLLEIKKEKEKLLEQNEQNEGIKSNNFTETKVDLNLNNKFLKSTFK